MNNGPQLVVSTANPAQHLDLDFVLVLICHGVHSSLLYEAADLVDETLCSSAFSFRFRFASSAITLSATPVRR